MSDQLDNVTPTPVVPERGPIKRTLDKVLADNWEKAWTWLSLYGYAIVIASPELFQMVMDLSAQFDGEQAAKLILPASFVTFLRTVGTVGMIVRLVRQSKKKIDDTAAALATAAAAAKAAEAAAVTAGEAIADAQKADQQADKA
jgi:hypothetical protein